MKLRALALVPLAASAVVLVGAAPAGAVACSVQQLTSGTGNTDSPRISADGTVVLFTSTDNLAVPAANPDHSPELFRIDLAVEPVPAQLTDTTGSEFLRGELSGDGDRVVFHSEGEHGDGADNGDGSDEIFLWDVDTGTAGIQQLTNSGKNSRDPDIDADGSSVAFTSQGDLTGDNADENAEIFLRDVGGPTTQLTETTGGNWFPQIDASGTRVVFASNVDLTGSTPDNGVDLFRVNTTTSVISLLADADDVSVEPEAVDADASVVAFTSDGEDLTGGNPDLSYEMYTHRAGAGVRQVSSLPGGGDYYVQYASLDATGNRLAFHSNGDLVGENAALDDYQLFVDDRTGRVGLDQVTHGAGYVGDTDMSADGSRIVAMWDADPVGLNPDGNDEVFLFTCGAAGPTFSDVRPGNFFYEQVEWMTAADVAGGFANGTFKPGQAVKRQQMANFLHNLLGRPPFTPPTTPTFSDVPASNPFRLQIEWMVSEGIASGFQNGTFKPGQAVKRQQMAKFLYVLAGEPAFTPPATPTFTDVATTNPFFLPIEWLVSEGVANGFADGSFRPGQAVKRQQMANFLLNLVNGPGIGLNL